MINLVYKFTLLLSILPEKEIENAAPWSIPISGERVSLNKSGVEVGSEQIKAVMCDSSPHWHEQFCVLVVDTAYSQRYEYV
ncbi:hypothetical protein [Nostoc sp.]|uniref:hypothetical protein n=1 Tax=Nostoc sp. TaxID=1180 RepID=UPI002FFB31A9